MGQRTRSEQRGQDERKAERRAARAEREERETPDLSASREHDKKHKPTGFLGMFIAAAKKSKAETPIKL